MPPENVTPKESVEQKLATIRAKLQQHEEATETFPLGEMGELLRVIFSHHPEVNNASITCFAESHKGENGIRVVGRSRIDGPIATAPVVGSINSAEVVLSTTPAGEIDWKLEKLNGKGGIILGIASRLVPKSMAKHEMAIGQFNLLQVHALGHYTILPNGSMRARFTPMARR